MSLPRRSTHTPNRVAFTLVELLVVIGIIAVLIGILLPTLGRARQQASSVACMSNMREIGNCLVMFTSERKGWLPKAWFNARPKVTVPTVGRDVQPADYSASDSWGYRYPFYGWDYVLMTYTKQGKKVFRCPIDDSEEDRGKWNNGLSGLPDVPEADDIPASYRINISNQPNQAYDAIRISQLRKPATSILLCESGRKPPGTPATDAVFHHVATWESEPAGSLSQIRKWNVAQNRHLKTRSNYVFADGHVESLTWDETWKPIGPQVWPGNPNFYNKETMWRQRYDVPPGRTSPHPDQRWTADISG
jgi:prepilin-type processing-associated H-X9-DG protein